MATDKQKSDELQDSILDHEYDGIKELDNPPPKWIMAIFYITIGASIIYGAYYFWLGVGDHQEAEYAKKSELHDAKYQLANQSSEDLVMLTDDESLKKGGEVYTTMNCFACHGMHGEGNAIGPNLCDEYWLNGCSFNDVFNIIKNGNPAKGMTPFKGQINDEKIQQVASYILGELMGTTPENAKAPQGEKCSQ